MKLNGHTIIAFVLAFVASASGAQEWIGATGPTYSVNNNLKADNFALGLTIPESFLRSKVAPVKSSSLYSGDLPVRWDWREHGQLTPIKNQGSCGSCWAFSAYATIADVYSLHGKGVQDLSEQHLVSCEPQSSGCGGGWYHYAFDLVKKDGSVQEKDFPYAGRDLKCPANLPHGLKIQGWKAICNEVCSTEDIKRAIYTYGPVAVAVSVTGDFQNYSGGIYNNGSGGTINHAVNLIGWDDSQKPGHWIMRNSWGSGWGEAGYMRIAYGAKLIGYAASFVDFAGPVPNGDIKPTPSPDPTPTPAPGPTPCEPCTFWKWLLGLF